VSFGHIKRETGIYETIGEQKYFVPNKFPPEPPLNLDHETVELYGYAMQQLGKLEEMMLRVPNNRRFLNSYIAKEALLSSEIEGIHTTLVDVLGYTVNAEKPKEDNTRLVCNYIDALNYAITMVRDDGFPIVSRVIRDSHRVLLSSTSDGNDNPGEFRRLPVRVGKLIPPPAHRIEGLIVSLEQFINNPGDLPPLMKAGVAHVQFETVHPFLDGNGRIGRLLIVLMLIQSGLISQPLLYPSYYFKKNRSEYYARLDSVRTQGDWEGWNKYYLRAIVESSIDALRRAKEIEELVNATHEQVVANTGRNTKTAVMLARLLCQYPVMSITDIAERLDKSYDTAKRLVDVFVKLKILSSLDNKKRNKVYQYNAYIDILEKDFTI